MIDPRPSSALLNMVVLIMIGGCIYWMSARICVAKKGVALDGHMDHTTENERPVIAVVQVEGGGSLLRALLEEHLSRNDRYVLVEREHIDQVFREQELSALSDASSVSKRVALGRLLGADLLVLLSERTSPKPHCEITVSETSRGLRLQRSKLLLSHELGNDAQEIEEIVKNALRKLAEPSIGIYAVPPFVSRDLSETYAHLQMAYARMLETVLLQIPGILVVELAEARAIAAEASLTGGNVERSLPLYLLGEFRYDAANPQMPPYVKITARVGERIVGRREVKMLSPEAAAPFLRRSVLELVGEDLGRTGQKEDIALECQMLSR
ncbi:MAG: hypothetical protein K9N49_10685, partial [Candidatus Marinimicrobia bacterium]|nr:hypothetical protein [Candidatus Neomarinimicrobiota bacterium]